MENKKQSLIEKELAKTDEERIKDCMNLIVSGSLLGVVGVVAGILMEFVIAAVIGVLIGGFLVYMGYHDLQIIKANMKQQGKHRSQKTKGMTKTMKMLLCAAGIIVLAVGYVVYSELTHLYYREGNYADHKCSYSYGYNNCPKDAVCKVKYYSSIYYYCDEHAGFGKDFVTTIKGYEETRKSEKDSDGAHDSSIGGLCKSCGKQYEAGDEAGNYMNIAKTGMCKNCYNNFNDLKGFLD